MKTGFCIVAIFKNESEILQEWIEHYLREGCARVFMIDNGSTDAYQPIIERFSQHVEVVIDDTRHAQNMLYNKHFLHKVKDFEWTLVCDLDEFIYARKQHATIDAYLKSLSSDITQVFIPWKIFGSNHFKMEPPSVVENFTKRINYDKTTGFQGIERVEGNLKYGLVKSIVRVSALEELGIHHSRTNGGLCIQSNGSIVTWDEPLAPFNEAVLAESALHLNHYAIRSLDWFTRIKMVRGSAALKCNENIRTRHYFTSFDTVSNDIEDDELMQKSALQT